MYASGTIKPIKFLIPPEREGDTAFRSLAREAGLEWGIAREMTFLVFCAAIAAARRATK